MWVLHKLAFRQKKKKKLHPHPPSVPTHYSRHMHTSTHARPRVVTARAAAAGKGRARLVRGGEGEQAITGRVLFAPTQPRFGRPCSHASARQLSGLVEEGWWAGKRGAGCHPLRGPDPPPTHPHPPPPHTAPQNHPRGHHALRLRHRRVPGPHASPSAAVAARDRAGRAPARLPSSDDLPRKTKIVCHHWAYLVHAGACLRWRTRA